MTDTPNPSTQPTVGRNEPCPCGSGRKYKRCCGVAAAPKLTPPKSMAYPEGMDPEALKSQMDPQMMNQFAQMMGRLPKGQLQKLQSIMQRAMAGKDVSREAQEFERTLPLDLQTMLASMQLPGQDPTQFSMPPGADELVPQAKPASSLASSESPAMSEDEARKIVEAAAKEGKISSEEASTLLSAPTGGSPSDKGFSKLWKKLSGK